MDLEDRNENSIAIRLIYDHFALLLTSDAKDQAERMMIDSGRPLNSTIFKAGHHGSRSSSSRAFLQAIQPEIIIVSAGNNNKYEHPHPEILQRAEEIRATVLRTGNTLTHALLPGSPAIDAGGDYDEPFDQRGVPRPQSPAKTFRSLIFHTVNHDL